MYDAHCHYIPIQLLDWMNENSETIHVAYEKKFPNKAEFLSVNGKWAFELKPSFTDLDLFIQQQNDASVNHSLLSPIPQLFLYEFPVDVTREMVQVYTRSLAECIRAHPGRLAALATVTLQSPEQAAADLTAAISLGLKGAIIGPGHDGALLSDPQFTPLWEEANRLGAVLFIHPLLNTDPRVQRRMMPNLIGVPWETTISAADILLSGMMDSYPNVKIMLAHGGGFLPYQIGRMSKGYEMWPQVKNALQAPPSEYLKRFWFDSVLWNQQTLDYLVTQVGADRIVPGSDYPFDLCELPTSIQDGGGYRSLIGL